MVGANLGIFLLAFKEEKGLGFAKGIVGGFRVQGLGFSVQLWNQPELDPVSYASKFRPQNESRPLRDDIHFLVFYKVLGLEFVGENVKPENRISQNYCEVLLLERKELRRRNSHDTL